MARRPRARVKLHSQKECRVGRAGGSQETTLGSSWRLPWWGRAVERETMATRQRALRVFASCFQEELHEKGKSTLVPSIGQTKRCCEYGRMSSFREAVLHLKDCLRTTLFLKVTSGLDQHMSSIFSQYIRVKFSLLK